MLVALKEFFADILRGDLMFLGVGRRILIVNNGFVLKTRKSQDQISWDNIKYIESHYTDAVPPFLPEIEFRLQDTRLVLIGEEVRGFHTLRRELNAHFPSIPEGWYEAMIKDGYDSRITLYDADSKTGPHPQ